MRRAIRSPKARPTPATGPCHIVTYYGIPFTHQLLLRGEKMKKAEAPSTTLHSNHQLVAQIVSEERRLRTWLRKKGVTGNQIDDIVQETYMRIMSRTSNDLVAAPLAYAKRTALSILQQQSRRLRIAAFEQLDCLVADRIPDPYPDPEQNVQWRTMLV